MTYLGTNEQQSRDKRIGMAMRTARWWDPRTWLAFMFWELRTMFAAVRDDGQSDWKAMIIIVIFEILAMFALTDAAAVYLGRRFIDKGSPLIYLLAFAIAVLNTPAIVGKHRHWDRLGTEFEGYPTFIRLGGAIAVVLLIAAAIFLSGHFGAAVRLLPP
jgi:hypothetical protein